MECRFDGEEEAVLACAMSEGSPHVLFVCTGNTCRSPMAEGMFRAAAEGAFEAEVSSAGIAAYGGGPASQETIDLLQRRGVSLDGFRSRPVSDETVRTATHIFCMTRGHREALRSIYPEQEDKLFLVCEFAEIDGEVGRDVPDPIGGGRGAYESVASCLDEAIAGILGFLRAEAERGGD